MRCLLLVMTLGACGQPAPPPRPPLPVDRATPPKVTTTAFEAPPIEVPAPLEPLAMQTVCSSAPSTSAFPAGAKSRIYEFSGFHLGLTYGPPPTAASGPQRDPDAIRHQLERSYQALLACARHGASSSRIRRRSLEAGYYVDFQVGFTLDPFGVPSDVQVDGDAAAAACVRDTIAALQFGRRTPRATRVRLALSVVHLEAVKPLATAPRPPVAAERPTGCMVTLAPLPEDQLDVGDVLLDAREPPPRPPRRCVPPDVDKAELRAVVRASLGQLRACYVDAARRTPGLAGTLAASFELDRWGRFVNIQLAGPGDPAFHTCFTDVLGTVATRWLPTGPYKVSMPFALDPAAPAWATPEAAIAAEDPDRAATMFASAPAPTPDAACRARLGVVKAYGRQPHGPDARTLEAIEALAAFIATQPPSTIEGCVEDARAALVPIATWPIRHRGDTDLWRWRGEGLDDALVRASTIVETLPQLAPDLLPFIGMAQATLHRHDDALATYLQFFALGVTDAAKLRDVADAYARSAQVRDTGGEPAGCDAAVQL